MNPDLCTETRMKKSIPLILIVLAFGAISLSKIRGVGRPVSAEIYAKAAEQIIERSGVAKGYCVVYGCEKGQLAYELAKRSELKIVGVEEDVEKVNLGRAALDDAEIYGDRITIHSGSLSDLPYRDYAAKLVVSDSIIVDGKCSGSAAEMFRMVRPAGGIALIGQPGGCPRKLKRSELERWLDEGGLSYKIIEDSNGLWARIEREPLPGAGEWTHMWADPANTACSGDERITDKWKVLWFGGPGPRFMVDRHKDAACSLYKAGRLVIPCWNRVVCVDAYNGARLWEKDIPKSARIAVLKNCGWMAMADDYIYFAVEDKCLKVELDTGRVVETYHPPTKDKDWGYIAVVGDLLFGSEQISGASCLYPKDKKNRSQLITSKTIFCRDRHTGELKWTYSSDSAIANPTICVGGDSIYFLETSNPKAVRDKNGRIDMAVFTKEAMGYVVKLDKKSGKVLSREQKELPFHNIMYLNYADGIVLASGSRYDADKKCNYYVRAFKAGDLSDVWHRDIYDVVGDSGHAQQDKHPVIVGDTIYYRFGCLDLQTGKPTDFTFKTTNCSDCSASKSHLFVRIQGKPGICNINGSGLPVPLSTQMRPGCYISIIPAGGIIMLPESSAGCTCAYAIQTSIAWIPQ